MDWGKSKQEEAKIRGTWKQKEASGKGHLKKINQMLLGKLSTFRCSSCLQCNERVWFFITPYGDPFIPFSFLLNLSIQTWRSITQLSPLPIIWPGACCRQYCWVLCESCLPGLCKLGSACTHHLEGVNKPAGCSIATILAWISQICVMNSQWIVQWCAWILQMHNHKDFHHADKTPHVHMSYHCASHRDYNTCKDYLPKKKYQVSCTTMQIEMPQKYNNCCHKAVSLSFW